MRFPASSGSSFLVASSRHFLSQSSSAPADGYSSQSKIPLFSLRCYPPFPNELPEKQPQVTHFVCDPRATIRSAIASDPQAREQRQQITPSNEGNRNAERRLYDSAMFSCRRQRVSGSISTRKLVLESAKLNVITAYSPEEAVRTLDRFPNLDGVVLDTQIQGLSCTEVVKQLRSKHARIPIVTVSPGGQDPCGDEQYHVSNFSTKRLLETLQKNSKRITCRLSTFIRCLSQTTRKTSKPIATSPMRTISKKNT